MGMKMPLQNSKQLVLERELIEMNDRNQDRDGNRNNKERREPRERLTWEEIERIQHGYAIGTVNMAQRSDGTVIYSWCLGKESRRDDRVMKFLDPKDIENSQQVLADVREFIEEEKSAERGA